MTKKTNFSQLYGLAYSAYAEGNYLKSYSYIDQLVTDFPEDANVLLLQGHVYVELEKYGLAIQAYNGVIRVAKRQDLIDCAKNALEQIHDKIVDNYDYNNTRDKHNRIDDINLIEEVLQGNQYDKSSSLEIELLKKEIEDLKIKVNQFNLQNITASFYPHFLQDRNVVKLIDFPLSRVIDIYHEAPQILEANGCLVSLVSSAKSTIFELNNVGNFWLFQLRDQGFYLFPKPGQLQRASLSDSFSKIFIIENKENENNGKFIVLNPAKLQVLKVGFSWQLIEPGEIKFEEFSLEFQWQQEIKSIRKEYEKFNQLLDERGYAGLDFTIVSQQWEQSLTKQYGNVHKIFVNTCMPIAYAIYKDQILVPCQILMGTKPVVVPGWDQGLPWEHSTYGKLHLNGNTSQQEIRTFPNHKILPNQLYLKENNWKVNHTWAIAKSYEEATIIVQKLSGNWQPLK
jgi:tetratricopeptide (TPR) repeat protein